MNRISACRITSNKGHNLLRVAARSTWLKFKTLGNLMEAKRSAAGARH
jgi:hypothetical protein